MKMRTTFTRQLMGALAIWALCLAGASAAEKPSAPGKNQDPAAKALATLNLYNPTGWERGSTIEVPTGSLGAPGLIDWSTVRLMSGGREIPFALREGRVHWKARLTAPVRKPRAEDLLVFAAAVPSGQWVKVEVVPGKPAAEDHLTRKDGAVSVAYPGLLVTVDEASGMLTRLEAAGENLLAGPLALHALALGEPGLTCSDGMGPGFTNLTTITLKKNKDLSAPKAKLVSSSSSPALTELNFALDSGPAPAMGLTYRIHPEGLVELIADERPWQGTSPWIRYAMDIKLGLSGESQALPTMQTRYPFYGFKDYSAAVTLIGAVHRGKKVGLLETGEETVNGRSWNRKLYLFPQDKERANEKEIIEVANKGLIVDATPLTAPLAKQTVKISAPADSRVIAATLAKALENAGLKTELTSGKGDITFKLSKDHEADRIEGDGFIIAPQKNGRGILITAGTRFGLMTAACRIADYLKVNPAAQAVPQIPQIPLLAANPAVNLRASGPGGGTHEVDFAYGEDAEWLGVFDRLIDSGMNSISCLGMWGNWKMPAKFKYMPELYSTAPDAYDEVSGAKLAEYDLHRARGLKYFNYLHDRGVKVWLWIPIGCVPTTFAKKFPEAMCPGSDKVPQSMHPKYRQYLNAYFKELLETYPVDGFIMIRDDNGGLDTSAQYKDYVAKSRTKDPVWEQCLIMYDMFRKMGFKGELAVYPYNDAYSPRLDAELPKDLIIAGHGSGIATFSRNYEQVGPMGDCWLDNLYTNFRMAPSTRMKRLLSNRSSYWLGGAYCGTELPWESIGYFGWQPEATVNSFRYQWGAQMFGKPNALTFTRFNDAYEELWDIMNLPMLPYTWLNLKPEERVRVAAEGRAWLKPYQQYLEALKKAAGNESNKKWFAHVGLYGTYFEYTLKREELLAQLFALVTPYKQAIEAGKKLPEDVRQQVRNIYAETYKASEPFVSQVKAAPGAMMRYTEPITPPYKEWVGGFNMWLDANLAFRQFAGSMTVKPLVLQAGKPFTLTVELANKGVCPWIPNVGHRLVLDSGYKPLALPELTGFEAGEWILPGEKRAFTLNGTAPAKPGSTQLKIGFTTPFRDANALAEQTVRLEWK